MEQKVGNIVNEKLEAGSYEVEWNGNDLASGRIPGQRKRERRQQICAIKKDDVIEIISITRDGSIKNKLMWKINYE